MHTSCTLNDGFKDNGGYLLMTIFKYLSERRYIIITTGFIKQATR